MKKIFLRWNTCSFSEQLMLLIAVVLVALWMPTGKPSRIQGLTLSQIEFNKKGDITKESLPMGIANPYVQQSPPDLPKRGRTLIARGTFVVEKKQELSLTIRADDCPTKLVVNKTNIPLKHVPKDLHCDMGTELSDVLIPKKALQKGENSIALTFVDYGGGHGVSLAFPEYHFTKFNIIQMVVIGLLCAGILLTITKKLQFSPATTALLFTGIGLCLIYLSYTGYNDRGHDVTAHLENIQYYISHHWMPDSYTLWQGHQPPVYYAAAAILYSAVGEGAVLNWYQQLQLFSLFFYVAFLIAGLKTITLFLPEGKVRLLMQAVFVCWPSGVMHSIRLGNDPIFYAAFAIAFYLLCASTQRNRVKQIPDAVIASGAAMLVKFNAIILLPLAGLRMLQERASKSRSISGRNKSKKMPLKAVAICLALALLSVGNNLYYAISERGELNPTVNITPEGNNALSVQNQLYNYVSFDYKTFITYPYFHSFLDESGRQHFWNALLKTMLFGEFQHTNDLHLSITNGMSFLLLVLMGCGIFFAIRGAVIGWRDPLFLQVAAILFSIAALMAFRAIHPFGSNNDFRYIYPAIVPLLILFGTGFHRLLVQKKTVLAGFVEVLVILQLSLSILFIIAPLISR